ncbi:girdin [Anabrus simplex]|uniref:girdin n=1 Tax=Anabrus simplex TaxID=316456 RepID=UPI0035A2833C
MTTTIEIEDFMAGPLVTWLYSCLDDRSPDYEELTDGVLLYEVLLQIDPEPLHHGVVPSLGNPLVRIRNMDIIVKNIKALYEEELCQVVLVLPDCVKLGREPESKDGLEGMQLLLLLLLGCAVQCPNKESFIERIKGMSVEVQHGIVDCIKQVTDNHHIVLTQDTVEVFPTDLMLTHIRRLVKERDEYLQLWAKSLTQDRPTPESTPTSEVPGGRKASSVSSGGDTHHLAVELADWKARLRKQRQELEEKSEALVECREELEHHKTLVSRLRQEVQELMQDARAAKAYRDELDAVRERAERVDKLESEVQRYREKLSDIEFYKTRVEELREDNRVLLETREMLEEQLQRARKRGEHILELEGEIIKYKQQINELSLEREASEAKLHELFEENAQLQVLTRSVLNESSAGVGDIESDNADFLEGGSGDNSLSEQLSSNAQARALKLELENRRLLSAIDNLKESSFHESSNKILELEKEKKKLSLKVDQLQENCQRLNKQNSELEQLFKDALVENRKLQDSTDNLKLTVDKCHQELQGEKTKAEELERGLESVGREKQQLQTTADSLKRKVEDLEQSAEGLGQQVEKWKSEGQRVPQLETACSEARAKVESLEKELQAVHKEVAKLKQAMEEKDVALDQNASEAAFQQKEMTRISKELEEATAQIARLHEVERESQELASRAAVDREMVEALQNDLVAHKLRSKQLHSCLEKLGLDPEQLVDPDTALDRIVSSPEVVRAVKELLAKEQDHECCGSGCKSPKGGAEPPSEGKDHQCEELRQELLTLQAAADEMQSENATLQVTVSMLQSQNSSLSTQHTALQLANSQLVAEKEELVKERSLQQAAHEQLLLDQVTLQSLHEQLTSEYERLLREREGLKAGQRDLRSELRVLKEHCDRQEQAQTALQQEKEKLKTESRSLGNLRAEHSSLKDDFRNLFTANEKLKQEYRSLQEEYRTQRVESGNLKLRATELQGELAQRQDHTTALEVELSKMTNKCEMLLQMNSGLEDDRRSLMEHVSRLLSQYHELLTHSLEDKQHYHMEEKNFTDKVNNLCRQKEKLEEKIMEHYRKLDSCSTKKKSFGATLVKRVRKAGSDFINKVPRNRRSWHEDSRRSEDQSRPSLGSESGEGGNESDTSMDELRARLHDTRSADGFTQSTLSLGSAGTRRTVYYTGEENNESRTAPPQQHTESGYVKDPDETAPFNSLVTETPTPQQDPRFLVYNRISTVIGGNAEEGGVSSQVLRQSPSQVSLSSSHSQNKLEEGSKRGSKAGSSTKGGGKGENSIWYEYGCV